MVERNIIYHIFFENPNLTANLAYQVSFDFVFKFSVAFDLNNVSRIGNISW